jgi:hypothetical protein
MDFLLQYHCYLKNVSQIHALQCAIPYVQICQQPCNYLLPGDRTGEPRAELRTVGLGSACCRMSAKRLGACGLEELPSRQPGRSGWSSGQRGSRGAESESIKGSAAAAAADLPRTKRRHQEWLLTCFFDGVRREEVSLGQKISWAKSFQGLAFRFDLFDLLWCSRCSDHCCGVHC